MDNTPGTVNTSGTINTPGTINTSGMDNTSRMDNITHVNPSKVLWGSLAPILLFIGLMGNTIVLLILLRKRKEFMSSTTIFRCVLAVTDMVVLCAVLPKYWIEYVLDIDIRSFSDFGCQFSLHITYVSMQYSAWILVIMTMHRCLLIYKPFTFKRIWTKNVTIIVLIVVYLIITGIDFHYFFTNGIINGSCDSKNDEIRHFENYVFVFVDLAFLCLIPFAIMFLGNIYFMFAMKSQNNFRQSLTEGQRITNNNLKNRTFKATRLVMKLTWLFLLTTLPICIEMIVDSVLTDYKWAENGLDIAKTICYLIQLTGFSLNVCIYISHDTAFRRQLGMFFNCIASRDWARSSSTHTSRIYSMNSEGRSNSSRTQIIVENSSSIPSNKESKNTNFSTEFTHM